MQLVLERGSIDKPVNFDIALIQLIFHTSVLSSNTHKGAFNPNVTTSQLSQIAARVYTLVLFIFHWLIYGIFRVLHTPTIYS